MISRYDGVQSAKSHWDSNDFGEFVRVSAGIDREISVIFIPVCRHSASIGLFLKALNEVLKLQEGTGITNKGENYTWREKRSGSLQMIDQVIHVKEGLEEQMNNPSISSTLFEQDIAMVSRLTSVTTKGYGSDQDEIVDSKEEEQVQMLFQPAFDAYFESIFKAVESQIQEALAKKAVQVLDVSSSLGQGKAGPLPLLARGSNSLVDKEEIRTPLQHEDSLGVEPARNLPLSHEEQLLIDGLLSQTPKMEASTWADSIQPELDLMLIDEKVEEQARGDFQKRYEMLKPIFEQHISDDFENSLWMIKEALRSPFIKENIQKGLVSSLQGKALKATREAMKSAQCIRAIKLKDRKPKPIYRRWESRRADGHRTYYKPLSTFGQRWGSGSRKPIVDSRWQYLSTKGRKRSIQSQTQRRSNGNVMQWRYLKESSPSFQSKNKSFQFHIENKVFRLFHSFYHNNFCISEFGRRAFHIWLNLAEVQWLTEILPNSNLRSFWALSRYEEGRKVYVSYGFNRWGSYVKIRVTKDVVTNSVIIPVDRDNPFLFSRALDSFFGKIIDSKIDKRTAKEDVTFSASGTNNSQAKEDVIYSASGIDERSAKALASTSFKDIPSSSSKLVSSNSCISSTAEISSDSTLQIKEETNLVSKDKKLGDFFSQLWIQFLQLNVDKFAAFIDGFGIQASLLSKLTGKENGNLAFLEDPMAEDPPLEAQNTLEEEPDSPLEDHSNSEQVSSDRLALVQSFEPIQAIYPLVDHSQVDHSAVRAYHSDSEIFVKEDNIAFLPFFRDQTDFDPDPEPYREWYPDDGIEPDDHLRRWGGPKGLTTALIGNNDEGRIIFKRGCVCGSSPPAPRRSLRLARRRHLHSPIRSECSFDTRENWES
ncbi:unnamed protein product [Cuscuta campestris]|uniref:Uncharacterized protein n=1 Tax=Cuscuta campestris TaxID=132261 RepID=A0A484NFT0_9ASTE|nr:unnamed protein product [Cuscuta campestris]